LAIQTYRLVKRDASDVPVAIKHVVDASDVPVAIEHVVIVVRPLAKII
jgi:hypothetical protein